MKRVIVVLAFSGALSACAGSSDMGTMLNSTPEPVSVRIESEPQGAEAKVPTGATCQTPCSLPLPANETTPVSFSLNGYQPQTIPVSVKSEKTLFSNPEPTIEPNPVYAVLQAAPPPRKKAPPRKKPAARKPAPKAPAASSAAPPPPAPEQQQPSGFGPPPPPSGGFGPPQQPSGGFGPPQQQ